MASALIEHGRSYGYQVSVATTDVPHRGHVGTFGWSGGTGCVACHDPVDDVTAVLLTNRAMGSPTEEPAFAAFLDAVLA